MGFSKDCSRTRKDSENQGIKEKVDTKKAKGKYSRKSNGGNARIAREGS